MILQSTVLNYFKFYNVKPNFIIVFITCVALLQGSIEGAVFGFFIGLAQDMLFGKMLGFYALLGLYLGFASGSLNKKLYRDNLVVITFITFVSTIIHEGFVFFFNMLEDVIAGTADLIFAFKNIILIEAVCNSIVSLFIYVLLMRFSDVIKKAGKTLHKY